MDDRVIDSLTSVVQQWKEVNINDLLDSVLPSEETIKNSQNSFQSTKSNLQSATKKIRNSYSNEIPRHEAISLLSQYDSTFQSIKTISKENDNSLAQCYTRLATVDNPSGLLQLTSSTIKSIPDFNFQINEIKQEAENERKKGEIALTLLKTLNDLKKECDEQISIAKNTAASQSKIDFEVSLSEYQSRLKDAQNSLKAVKLEFDSITILKETKINELKTKESEIDMKMTAHQEQIEALQNELNDTNQALNETEKKQEEIEKSGSIVELTNSIQKINDQIDELDNKANEIRNEIFLRRKEKENKNEKLNQKINELKKSIDSIEKLLSELPSQSQWSQIKNSYEKIKIINEKEKKKEILQNEACQVGKEVESRRSQLNSKNQDLLKIKKQFESEKKNINDAIDHFKSTTTTDSTNKKESENNRELISIIQTQIENLIQSDENNVKYSLLLKQQNQLKRSTKETLENEVNHLKKQLKNVNKNNNMNFDPENPQLIVSTTIADDEDDEEIVRSRKRRRKRLRERSEVGSENFFTSDYFKNDKINDFCEKASNTVNDLCILSRPFRFSVFIILILFHLIILFGAFRKK